MKSFKKVAKSVGSNRVHPTESHDADSEMPDRAPRRRASFSHDVHDSSNSPSAAAFQKTGSMKPSPDTVSPVSLRRPSLDARSPLSARSSSPAFRRRSLSNGSVGGELAGLAELTDGRTSNLTSTTTPVQVELQSNPKKKVSVSQRAHDAESVVAKPKSAEHVQSLALQRFFSSAQSSNSWSAASKKMIFGSDIDDAKLQNRAKLEARALFFCKMLTFCACFSTLVACLTSRFEEDARNSLVSSLIQEGVVNCCSALNSTLDSEGSCPVMLSNDEAACSPDNSLIVSHDTDFVVASNTTVYIQANAGRAFVSLLSFFNVILLILFYTSKAQYAMLLEHLERNQPLHTLKRVIFPEIGTIIQFCVEGFILFAHLPPGDFESPVLIIESVFYGQPRILKYPWIALSSLWCTLRLYTVVRLARDVTLAKWSSKKKLLERQSGVSINTAFALKVMMAESPVAVVGGSFIFLWILCSYWMLVFERNHQDIRKYQDTIWLSFVTASTVGYGDLFPHTLAGRFVSVLAGIIGIIVCSFGTAALCRNLALTNSEFKTKNLISRGDMDRSICVSAATYIQRYFRYKWKKASPYASFWNPAIDIQSASNEFIAAKRDYDVWLKSQVNLIISLKRMLEESEIIMKFTNFLSNDTGESTKHFNLDASGFASMPELEQSVRELRDYLAKLWNEAPAKAKSIAQSTAPGNQTSKVQPTVDLTNFGNRIRSLAEMCKDNNTDLESACISVQRSGVGFVNPRVLGSKPQKMQQQGLQPPHQSAPSPHIPFQQHHPTYQQYSFHPSQYPAHQMIPDLSASTQAVMQIANIKLMTKLVDAINRIGGRDSESSEQDTEDGTESNESDRPSPPSSSRRPISLVSQSSQRPSSASGSGSRPPSAVSLRPGSGVSRESGRADDGKVSGGQREGRASATVRPFSASGFIASDEARSHGARYMQ